jgi:hypothetical protein
MAALSEERGREATPYRAWFPGKIVSFYIVPLDLISTWHVPIISAPNSSVKKIEPFPFYRSS